MQVLDSLWPLKKGERKDLYQKGTILIYYCKYLLGKMKKDSFGEVSSIIYMLTSFTNYRPVIRGVTIHFFHKRYISRYLVCITIRFIGNCNYSLKSMLVEMGAAMFFLKYEVAYVLAEIINI